jgi:hypothetical protein
MRANGKSPVSLPTRPYDVTVDQAIYFPYIDVPNSPTLTRVLLYWDVVGSIVPRGISHRGRAAAKELTDTGLVREIHPEDFADAIQDLDVRFFEILKTYRPVEDDEHILMHAGKFGGPKIWRTLTKYGIAVDARGEWYPMPRRIAGLYMAYLAGLLGSLSEEPMEPITDLPELYRDLISGPAARIDHIRGAILRDVLPAPTTPVAPERIARFKEIHGELLRGFRRRVEQRAVECAREPDPQYRKRLVTTAAEDFAAEVDEISARMSEHRFPNKVGMLCATVVAAPLAADAIAHGDPYKATAAGVLPLAEALRGALNARGRDVSKGPMAYAALARTEFGLE